MSAASRLLYSLCVLLAVIGFAPSLLAQDAERRAPSLLAQDAERRAPSFLAQDAERRAPSFLAQDAERRAPYAALRWEGDAPQVELDGTWHALLSIDGTAAEEIAAFCRATWPDRWQKRFAEDLVEVLVRMQHPPGATVALGLRDLATGESSVRRNVPMTEANREALRKAGSAARIARARREHAEEPDARYADLARSLPATPPDLTRQQAHEDLDQLEEAMRTGFAYRDRLGVDVEAAFDAVRLACKERVPRAAFNMRLQELMALFGDGHSGVVNDHAHAGSTPFLVETTTAGVVAFLPDRSGFLDEEYPILAGLDEHPLDVWLQATSRRVARGAPDFVQTRALRELRRLAQVRAQLGRLGSEAVEVELRSLDGQRSVRRKVALQEDNPTYGAWPRLASRRLNGDVGYLRIPQMENDPKFLDELVRTMGGFRTARALVIDVRGNGGGTRDVLLGLAPFLVSAQQAPLVVNVAAKVLEPGEVDGRDGLLADRFAYPLSWPSWSEAARAAIEVVARDFRPEWVPPRQPISNWHWFVLDRGDAPAEWTFSGKIAVLLDSACFSATDIFLAALDRLPNIVLVGQPSGGGSGRPRPLQLAHSRISVRLSTMVSYRVDGKLFEGRGVQPDVLVLPAPGDLVGRGDAQLDAALERLR